MPLLRQSAPEAPVKVEDPRLPATTEQEQRYEELYRTLFPRLIAYARHYVARDDADDAVHAAVTNIWWRWARLAPRIPGDATPFFYAAVWQQLAKVRRRTRRTERFLARGEHDVVGEWSARVANHGAELELEELAAVAEANVAALPDRPRAAWMLVRENQLTYEQAAHSLGIAPMSVKQLITRAQQRIREALVEAGYRLSARILPKRSRRSRQLLLPKSTEDAAHE
jgi:RNA polymerase sigma-70 factor, ECF subfamily